MKAEFLKRIFFDTLFMKLKNPEEKLISFSEKIKDNKFINKKYYNENSLKKI